MDTRDPTQRYSHWTEQNELFPERSTRSFSWASIILIASLGFILGATVFYGLGKQAQAMEWEQV